jgi:hypothetical protein
MIVEGWLWSTRIATRYAALQTSTVGPATSFPVATLRGEGTDDGGHAPPRRIRQGR